MKCSDISSRLVDFLYEEIAPAERAEFNAHLASCPTCAAEVKASSRALQRTRTALAGPLNEDPPARVHANILAAARAAAQPARKPRVPAQEGFFARLWKAPWLIPAMGAAGVATAVFLIKVIKNPEVLPVREPASPAALVGKPQPTESEAPAPATAPAVPQAEAIETPPANLERRAAAGVKKERARSAGAPAPTAAHAPVLSKRKLDNDPLAGLDMDVRAAPAAQKSAPVGYAAPSPKPAAAARPLNTPGGWAEPPPPRSLSGSKDHKADRDDLLMKEGASGAGASQPRGELLQARPQKSAEAARPAPAAPAASAYALPPAPAAAPAKPAPEPSEFRAKAKRAAEAESMADEQADSAPLRSISADKQVDHAEKKGSARPETFDERVRKADKLYAEKKWAQAAIAYSALLVEAPSHPSAPTWRQRFHLAESTAKSPPSNKAAKKILDNAVDGL